MDSSTGPKFSLQMKHSGGRSEYAPWHRFNGAEDITSDEIALAPCLEGHGESSIEPKWVLRMKLANWGT